MWEAGCKRDLTGSWDHSEILSEREKFHVRPGGNSGDGWKQGYGQVFTEERRKELTKVVKKMGEEIKVAIRNERRDANDKLKKMEKGGELTEDELKKETDHVQKKTDECIKEIDSLVAQKEKEILEV